MIRKIPFFGKFVAGSSLKDAIACMQTMKTQSIGSIIDYAVEDGNAYNEIREQITNLPDHSHVAIKCSALKLENGKKSTSLLLDQLCSLASLKSHTVYIDAERVGQQDIIDGLTNEMIQKYNKTEPVIFKTYQMYRRDTLQKLKNDIKTYPYLGIKLVRGAYHHQDEHSGHLFNSIEDTNENFNAGIHCILLQEQIITGNLKVLLASHNESSVHYATNILELLPDQAKDNVAFAQLLGMSDRLSDRLASGGYDVKKYVPYGPSHKMIPYLVRRLYENMGILKYLNK